jgi:tumor protein p53-inducible protein 3
MQAVIQDSVGDETTLYVGETTMPSIGADEILIRVACSALNRMDLLQRKGLYPVPKGASKIIGVEVLYAMLCNIILLFLLPLTGVLLTKTK